VYAVPARGENSLLFNKSSRDSPLTLSRDPERQPIAYVDGVLKEIARWKT
jgi:hypothetical protein